MKSDGSPRRRGRGEAAEREATRPSSTFSFAEKHRRRPPSKGRLRIGRRAVVLISLAVLACSLAVAIRRLSPSSSSSLAGSSVGGFAPQSSQSQVPPARPRLPVVQSLLSPGTPQKSHPRTVTVDPGSDLRGGAGGRRRVRRRTVKNVMWGAEAQERLRDDRRYDRRRREALPDGCEPLRPWQETSFPTCNLLHEVDRTVGSWAAGTHEWTNKGGYNLVFAVREGLPPTHGGGAGDGGRSAPSFAVKEIEYAYADATDATLSDVRMDALVMERLTSSPHVMDVLAHCGLTLAVAWGDVQLGALIFDGKNPPREEKLRLAVQVSSALADVENIDGDGVPPYVHQDYMVRQHLVVGGLLKLSDFNKGWFVVKRVGSSSSGELCEVRGHGKDWTFRAPEEYRGEPLTAKAQVFSLGNILQSILTGVRMWTGVEDKKARECIKRGERYDLPEHVRESDDPINVALKEATEWCFTHKPQDRPTATEVAKFLQEEAARLGVDVPVK